MGHTKRAERQMGRTAQLKLTTTPPTAIGDHLLTGPLKLTIHALKPTPTILPPTQAIHPLILTIHPQRLMSGPCRSGWQCLTCRLGSPTAILYVWCPASVSVQRQLGQLRNERCTKFQPIIITCITTHCCRNCTMKVRRLILTHASRVHEGGKF